MIPAQELKLDRQKGAATFLITALLLVSVVFITIFSANYSIAQQKTSANTVRILQASQAAEAGLEFGINYLKINSATILASPIGGFIQPLTNSSITNVVLGNGGTYTITYTNPIANNFNLILVTSTGVSSDGSTTRSVSQRFKFGSLLAKTPQSSIVAKGSVALGGSSEIVNLLGSATVNSGSSVALSGSAKTTLLLGGSNASHMGSDITQNNSTLNQMSSSDFFSSYFGVSESTVKSNASYTYSDQGNYNSVLNGKTGALIWIDQTSGDASINGSTVVGSLTSPVILVVNGSFQISGSATVYGIIIVLGDSATDVDITGSAKIYGAMLTAKDLNLKGNTKITYTPSVLTAIQQTINNYYAKVPGSWSDF